jgi:hypothetical protein
MQVQMRRVGISWKGIISVLNLILLIFLYLHLITKESEKSEKESVEGSASNNLRSLNISYKDSKLHEQKQFIERVGNKRAYSMSGRLRFKLIFFSYLFNYQMQKLTFWPAFRMNRKQISKFREGIMEYIN